MNKLKYLILILILLNLFLASAEIITLSKEQTKEYKEVELTLLKIGSYGSAHLKINKIEKTITRGGAEEIYGLRIKIISTQMEQVKLDITMTAECLQDSDCDDNNKRTKDLCIFRECEYKELTCCLINDQCKDVGSTEVIDGKQVYCSNQYDWIERKPYKTACTYNYECQTGYCDKYCRITTKTGIPYKMAPAWILIIIGALMILSSLLFLPNPKIGKIISKNIIDLIPNNYCRYMSLAAIVIGIVLIYWSLI